MTTEKRALLVGGVSLVKGRLKLAGQALLAARNELEFELKRSGYLKTAPFATVSVIIRYGEGEDLNPDIGEIDRKNSELPVALLLDLRALSVLSLDELTDQFRSVLIEVLCDVAANFDLPFEFLDEMRRPR